MNEGLALAGKTILVTLGIGGILLGSLQVLVTLQDGEGSLLLGLALLVAGLLAAGIPMALAVRDTLRAGRVP